MQSLITTIGMQKGPLLLHLVLRTLVANLKLAEPNITVDEIETRLKNTSYDVKDIMSMWLHLMLT